MPTIRDDVTHPFINLWWSFRPEVFRTELPDPGSRDDPWEAKGPTEALDQLWSQRDANEEMGLRVHAILTRVRAWLGGAEQSARDDRQAVVTLFDRCAADALLPGWERLPPEERGAMIDRLLRVMAGLSATIRNERPRRKDPTLPFRIDWDEHGDGRGKWESVPAEKAFSLTAVVRDLADLYGQFDNAEAAAVTGHLLAGVRDGAFPLPLLKRDRRSTAQTTWLRRVAPGRAHEKGLLLPERVGAEQDEIALLQGAPRVARVFEEACFVAAREGLESPEQDWGRIRVRADVADEPDAMRVTELCEELVQELDLSRKSACTFLAAPLAVICRKSKNTDLKKRAESSLAALQELSVR